MVKLKQFKLGDEIRTIEGSRWKTPFIVEVIYRGYIVAVNRRSKMNPQFMFIKTYTNEVYTGSSKYMKYGVFGKESIREFIDGVIKGEYKLDKATCVPTYLILSEEAFDKNETREQVRYQ